MFPQECDFVARRCHGFIGEKLLCGSTGIRLLEKEEVVLSGVRFLGVTLWTDFMLLGEGDKRGVALRQAQRFMRDFGGSASAGGTGTFHARRFGAVAMPWMA
jgi:hypothetical protein